MTTGSGISYGTGEPLEIYDLEADLGEKTNVAKEHPDVVAKIEGFMAAAHVETEHWPSLAKKK